MITVLLKDEQIEADAIHGIILTVLPVLFTQQLNESNPSGTVASWTPIGVG